VNRSPEVLLDPEYLASGDIGLQTAHYDTYFRTNTEPTLRIVVDYMLSQIPDPQRTAVQMCVMERISYAKAAVWFTEHRNKRTDPKTVWRWAQQGVSKLSDMFGRAGWAAQLDPRLDFEDDDE